VQYQSIRTGFDTTLNIEIDHLVRLSAAPSPPRRHYPAMNGFGGLGINLTMLRGTVFRVDPNDSRYIIAPTSSTRR
jgi:hypothetical protein